MAKAKGSMREQMPVVAAWIDEMRKAFGAAHIDGVIKKGMRGEPVFYASENGYTVGTPIPLGAAGPDLDSPAARAEENDRERKYREAAARSTVVITARLGNEER